MADGATTGIIIVGIVLTLATLVTGGAYYVYWQKQNADKMLGAATGGYIDTNALMDPAAAMAKAQEKAQEMAKQKGLAAAGLPPGIDMTSMNPDALKKAALEKAGGNMPSIPDHASLTASGLAMKNMNPSLTTLQGNLAANTTNATANATAFQDNLSKNFNASKEQFGPAVNDFKEKGTDFLNKGREQLPAIQKNATDAMNKLKNNTPELSTGAKAGLGLVGARALQSNKMAAFQKNIPTGQINLLNQGNIGRRAQSYQNELLASRNMTRQQGGGRKTKNNRRKVINDNPIFRQSVKKQRKPRTKKCLVSKGNQLYMSFCV